MAELSLGLDIGCGSIGWSLIDERGRKILAIGVRVFPEGVDRAPQGGEQSKNQARRMARLMRRQLARRSARKRHLRQALTSAGLLPSDPAALKTLLAANPYTLRRRALDEPLEPYEIGRVLLHLNQRRGFLSTRKTNRDGDSDTKGMLREMDELAVTIQAAGCRTLGEYLANRDEKFNHHTSALQEKVRCRHTRRAMIEDEFEAIWTAQAVHHPQLLTDQRKYGHRGKQVYPRKPVATGMNSADEFGVHGLMFLQRSTYWPKSAVGRCEFERREKRCPKADRAAQRFRILQEVNNLRLIDRESRQQRALSPEERTKLVDSLAAVKELKFDQIRKKLKFHDAQGVRFNLEATRDKLQGDKTEAALRSKKSLGKRWDGLAEETKDAIVSILIFEDNEDYALQRLQQLGLSPEEAKKASHTHLEEGYANLSRVAICNLLPHLERGLSLMGNDASDSALHAAGYLRPDEREVRTCGFLPSVPDLPNPIVRQALYEVRKVVNGILREYVVPSGHRLTRIHVELAREAKKSFEQREALRVEDFKRQRERETASREICAYDDRIIPTRSAVSRFRLWQEQSGSCPGPARTLGDLGWRG